MMTDDLRQDARYALRQLRRNPGFTSAAVITLAVGIGANSAVFSVVSGVLLEPLPYAAPERLVTVNTAFPSMGFDEFWMAPPEYYELREWNESFEDMGAYRVGAASIETLDRPMRVPAASASWSFFTTLGVSAQLGRTFSEEEDRIGAEPTVVISHGLWERGFAADPGVLGRTVRVSGQTATIVGVLPDGFDIEDAGVDIWRPMNLLNAVDPTDHVNRRGNHFMNVVARLRPGVTPELLRQDLDRVTQRSGEEYADMHPFDPEFHPIFATDLRTQLVGDVRPALFLLMGAVSFVLLIASANVANLLLARAESRSSEVAVRVAMGAGRGRMTRQLVTEGLGLSLLGGGLGLVLAHYGTRLLLGINPEAVPRTEGIGLDARVIGFTALVTVGTGLLFGLAPLLGATMKKVGATLKEGGTRTTRGSGARARKALVVAEVAFAVVLLVGSGLMIRSVDALQSVDLGFDAENALTLTVALPVGDYPEAERVGDFFAELLGRVRALPGVASASATSGLPPMQQLVANDTEFEGVPQTADGPAHNVQYYTGVESEYFETMGIRLAEGRTFEPADALAETPILIVNRRLAETFYPGESPVGRRLRPCCGDDNPWFTVVGVVEDVKQAGIGAPAGTELFFYNPQAAASGGNVSRALSIVVRAERDPMALAASVERLVRELDPALPVANVQSLEQNVSGAMAQPRFLTLLLGAFAGVALLLASVGTYGVMAHSVAERNREIGIRMAMGAEPGSVRGLVMKQGAVLAGSGLGLGVLGALGLSRFLSSQLYEVGATDLRTFVAVPVVLGAVALLACYIPARRATRVDPVEALREA